MINNMTSFCTKPKIYEVVKQLITGNDKTILKILDAPAGHGFMSHHLKQVGFDVYACDINESGFTEHSIPFMKVDLNKVLPYPDGYFNYIICIEGIEHLKNTWFTLSEFNRILKNEGKLIITTPNIHNFISRLKFFLFGSFRYFNSKINLNDNSFIGQHINPVWLSVFQIQVQNTGFKIEQILTDEKMFICKMMRPVITAINIFFNKANDGKLQSNELFCGDILIMELKKVNKMIL
jgi:SAM-dependent methyltransferase